MNELITLTDTEIGGVSGGNGISQSIYISAWQTNSSSVSQSATASNTGAVTASASGYGALAAAAGSEANNTAIVSQGNVIGALNSVRIRRW